LYSECNLEWFQEVVEKKIRKNLWRIERLNEILAGDMV